MILLRLSHGGFGAWINVAGCSWLRLGQTQYDRRTFRFLGKVALVTGGLWGLGHRWALALAQRAVRTLLSPHVKVEAASLLLKKLGAWPQSSGLWLPRWAFGRFSKACRCGVR